MAVFATPLSQSPGRGALSSLYPILLLSVLWTCGRVPVPVGDSSTNPQDPSPSDINPSVDNCPEISPIYPQILPKSRKINITDELWSIAIFQRLRRGDETAIGALVGELQGDDSGYWWQAGRYIWSNELTAALDVALERRSQEIRGEDGFTDQSWIDRILSERLMDLPSTTMEELLWKHWDDLAVKSEYVQVALYGATPRLLEAVDGMVKGTREPKYYFDHIMMHFGVRTSGRSGITRFDQVEGLMPYIDCLSEFDIYSLWEECGRNGWTEFRKQHLEDRVRSTGRGLYIDDNFAINELDKMVTRWPTHFSSHWTEMYLESGASLDYVMSVLRRWLGNQTDERALAVAGDIVSRVRNRGHKEVLFAFGGAAGERNQSIIDNATFTVERRSFV